MDNNTNYKQIVEYELVLSTFLSQSKLTAHDTIIALAVSIARILYGLETLYGQAAAAAGLKLLDTNISKAWELFSSPAETPNKDRMH